MKVNDVSEEHIASISRMKGKAKQETSVKEAARRVISFLPWRWRRYVRPKCRLTFTRLHGVIWKKYNFFST
jgi:hypothetical protein